MSGKKCHYLFFWNPHKCWLFIIIWITIKQTCPQAKASLNLSFSVMNKSKILKWTKLKLTMRKTILEISLTKVGLLSNKLAYYNTILKINAKPTWILSLKSLIWAWLNLLILSSKIIYKKGLMVSMILFLKKLGSRLS